MTHGKYTCRILKEIRQQIAQANDIQYTIEECQYKGDCRGTCPRCEAEVRYLEQQLNERRTLGKSVSLVGLSLSIAALSTQVTSCGTQPTGNNTTKTDTTTTDTLNIIEPEEDTIFTERKLMGEVLPETPKPKKKRKEQSDAYDENEICGILASPEIFFKFEDTITECLPAPVTYAEEYPTFQGKDINAFRKWCNEERKYPSTAMAYGVEGRVHVSFVVECDGYVSSVKVIRGADSLLDSAAIEVVERSPRWEPAKDRGMAVRFTYNVAIDFGHGVPAEGMLTLH